MITRLTLVLTVLVCMTYAAMAAPAAPKTPPPAPVDIKTLFEQRNSAWQLWASAQGEKASLTKGVEYDALRQLGPPAVGMMVAEMEKTDKPRVAAALAEMIIRITQKVFPKETNSDQVKLIGQWWHEGRKTTAADFEKNYAAWKACRAKGDTLLMIRDQASFDDASKTIVTKHEQTTDLGKAYLAMKGMGIDILPMLAQKLQAKEYDLLPLFADIARVQNPNIDAEKRAKTTLDWWGKNKEKYLLPAS